MNLPFSLPEPYEPFLTPEAAHAWGMRQQIPPLVQRPDFEKVSLRRYKGPFYRAINAFLRDDVVLRREEQRRRRGYSRHDIEYDVEALEEAIAAASTDRPVVAWRAFHDEDVAAFLLADMGGEFADRGFVSTTLSFEYAMSLLEPGAAGPVLLTILVPAHAPALYLEHVDGPVHGEREMELVLLRDSVFKIHVAQRDHAGVTHALLEL